MRYLITRRLDIMATVLCIAAATGCGRPARDSAARRDTPASKGAPNVEVADKNVSKVEQRVPSDEDVRQAVVDELYRGPHVRAGAIIVECNKGIVELVGAVDSLLAKDRAVALTKRVRGVRAVSDRLRVEPPARTDAQIEKGVKDALSFDPAADAYQVKVTATQGRVHLVGEVESWQERRLAERLARGVRGVKSVENDITVNALKPRADSEIAKDVQSRLRWNTFVNDGLINVKVQDGKVELSGSVGSDAEKTEAFLSAWVNGAREVDISKLATEPWERNEDLRKKKYAYKSDQEITSAIKQALSYDPRVKALNVGVQVAAGVVTLLGTVNSIKAKLAAESVARHTVGTLGVANQLRVEPGKPIADKVLMSRIQAAFESNPVLDASAIETKVAKGKVTLTGKVPTPFERVEAADVANGLEGVTSVSNQLQVTAPELGFVWLPDVFPYGPYIEEWYYVAKKPAQSDAATERNVRRELQWSPYVDANDVQVRVHDGKAILRGTVDSTRQRQAAAECALEGGAIAVDNQLQVGS